MTGAKMWQSEMERQRMYMMGVRPYRGNLMPHNQRQLDERLHGRGVSTSSNSSWTFSQGPADSPKGRRGSVCGAVLLAAVFVVVAAVVCVGGLAFYMGAKRVDSVNSNLVLDGNLRVTYGDQFKTELLDASSDLFLQKADRYRQMISIVLQKSSLHSAVKEVSVMRFTNGSNLHIGFRVHLDRRKIPEGVDALETVRKALTEEFSSVKPAAFRNMAVDLHKLAHSRGSDDQFEGAHVEKPTIAETRGKIVQKPTTENSKPKKVLTPVKGTSVQMSDLGETIKVRNNAKPVEKKEQVQSIDFTENKDSAEIPEVREKEVFKESPITEEIKIVKEVVKEVEVQAKPVQAGKPSKVYQSIFITSDNVKISNNTEQDSVKKPEDGVGSFTVTKSDASLLASTQPPKRIENPGGSYTVTKPIGPFKSNSKLREQEKIEKAAAGAVVGTYRISNSDTNTKSESVFTNPNGEEIRIQVKETTTSRAKSKDRNPPQIIRATTPSSAVNGHARPHYPSVPDPVNVGFAFAGASQDEPWRPIIPVRTKTPSTTESIFPEIITEKPPDEEPVITFSKKAYIENLKIASDYTDNRKNNSKVSDEVVQKYKEMLKEHGVDEVEEEVEVPVRLTSTEATSTSTQKVLSTVVVNPFKEQDDSRASSILKFGLPELPYLQQFHHLDSLLKSFAGGTAAGGTFTPAMSSTSTPKIETTTGTTTSTPKIETTTGTTAATATSPLDRTTMKTTPKAVVRLTTRSTIEASKHTTLKPITSSSKPKLTSPTPKVTKLATSTSTSEITPSTRFPIRRRPTTSNETVFIAVSTITPSVKLRSNVEEPTTQQPQKTKASTPVSSSTPSFEPETKESSMIPVSVVPDVATTAGKSSALVVKGEVEVLDQATAESLATTEAIRLVTLLPVRSNVNMKTPLRPRPPRVNSREARSEPYRFIDDQAGKRWVYYSSSKMTAPPEKLFIVTPEPVEKYLTTNQNEIQSKIDQVNKEQKERRTQNTSDLIQRIVQEMDNVAIASENSSSVIVKINSTLLRKTTVADDIEDKVKPLNPVISTKAVSSGGSNYKLNQAGVPILTKVLRKEPSVEVDHKNKSSGNTWYFKKLHDEIPSSHIDPTECTNTSFRCNNGICLTPASRCNQLVDCPDASDEKNCTCAEHLKAQRLTRKLCDGIVDCWDFSDEHDCEWCRPNQFLCSNSRACINQSQVCDGVPQCPNGDDERNCVRIAPSLDAPEGKYFSSGFLMVRKHGEWGKLCVDQFDAVSRDSQTGWDLSDFGKSVCRALTYSDLDKIERVFSVPNEGRSLSENSTKPQEKYFELTVGKTKDVQGRESSLSFEPSQCSGRQVAKVNCNDLQCGMRPLMSSQWSRIVGGGNASPGSWPWQAALYREGEFQCGATLVSTNWLVSAGHCFFHNQDDWWVARLGALRTSSSLPSPNEQIRSVAQIVVHPQYVDSGFLNDIALLRLSESVTLTDHVRPICLPPPSAAVRDGAICTVVGWGQLFELGRVFPDTLQEVQVPLISSIECRKRTLFLPLYKVTDDMLCAGYERGGRDACLGDSGGPLMCQEDDDKWSLYGVTSNGYGCARSNRPGVYTKVSRYLSWVHARIKADVHGVKDKQDKCKGHRCPLGECLPRSRLCNGYVECSDGSDEKDCWGL